MVFIPATCCFVSNLLHGCLSASNMVLMIASLKTLWNLQNLILDILLKPRPLQAFSKAACAVSGTLLA